MTVTCNYRSTAVIILPGVYLPPQRNATVADDAFSLLFISIHAPREGSDQSAQGASITRLLFQSTLPARGATKVKYDALKEDFISIHAPREGSDTDFTPATGVIGISIHAPREGSDADGIVSIVPPPISIHAPREGSDLLAKLWVLNKGEFQSTLPARGATRMR